MSELPRPGDVIRQKYEIERVLGQGGMAVIFAATHVHLRQRVALKLLRPEAPRDPQVVERFLREARAAIRLQSPHVARILDVDTLDDGVPFIVMEHLDGADLLAVSHQRPLPIADAVTYVRQACEAIAEAHALGIIHRDLKPANLFLARRTSGDPTVKVLDFGISKVLEDTRITAEQVGMGSAEYMSPEQIRSATEVDARSDIWSLGVTLYELCTQRTPFHAGGVAEVIAAILVRAPAPPRQHRPDMPPGLEAVILRCLDKDPAGRFHDVPALSAALAPFEDASANGPVGAVSRGEEGRAKARIPPAAYVAFVLAALIASVLAVGMSRRGAAAGQRFELAEGTVVDHEARLTWQRTPVAAAMDWTAARAHCAKVGEGFRLPEVGELEGLLAVMLVEPPLDPEAFGSTPLDVFWSATAAGPGAAMAVSFAKGQRATGIVSTRNRVRCVR